MVAHKKQKRRTTHQDDCNWYRTSRGYINRMGRAQMIIPLMSWIADWWTKTLKIGYWKHFTPQLHSFMGQDGNNNISTTALSRFLLTPTSDLSEM
jgi:hypothetical protein